MRSSRMSAKLMPFSCRYERTLPICLDITSEYSSDFICSSSSRACAPTDIPKDSVSQKDGYSAALCRLQEQGSVHAANRDRAPTCLSCN